MFKLITVNPSEKYHQLRAGDDGFYFSPDNLTLVPRASLVLSKDCPDNYIRIINAAIAKGWLKPVAHCTDQELVWQKLKK